MDKFIEITGEFMKTLLAKIAKLVDVKSIVTITMTVALIKLLFSSVQPSPELLALYCTSYGAVVTYFFTHKSAE